MLPQLQKLMESKPNLVSLDFETALLDGGASVEFYRPDFKVLSCAISWYDGETMAHIYCEGEDTILPQLQYLCQQNVRIVTHNVSFEYAIVQYRFHGLELNWHADTMRLAQVYDNGAEFSPHPGLSLVACCSRVLPKYTDHKLLYYQYLRDTHSVRKGHEGANLHLLPLPLLEAYNVADTDVTLDLYSTLIKEFKSIGYDWTFDHQFYMSSAKMIAESKGRGILIDQEKLRTSISALESELGLIKETFNTEFKSELIEIEFENLSKLFNSRSSEKGQTNAWLRAVEMPELITFNLTSSLQKEVFFCQKLKLAPKFTTPKGKPSFAKAFLKQWGRAGELLVNRGTLLLSLKQAINLQKLSEYDSRWHVDIKAAGTTTGRMAGGSRDE